jgi:hypothetical protein
LTALLEEMRIEGLRPLYNALYHTVLRYPRMLDSVARGAARLFFPDPLHSIVLGPAVRTCFEAGALVQ